MKLEWCEVAVTIIVGFGLAVFMEYGKLLHLIEFSSKVKIHCL